MINGSIFLIQMQLSDSTPTLSSCLNSVSCRNCVTAAVAYLSRLQNAALTIRRGSWPRIQLNVLCAGYYLYPLCTGPPSLMILCTSLGSAHL